VERVGFTVTKDSLSVCSIYPSSPAAGSGIQQFDMIVSVNGRPVADAGEFERAINRVKLGGTITIAVQRQGTIVKFSLGLDNF
jgi:serine protease Do